MSILEHALEYARRGWSVIPLRAKDKVPALSKQSGGWEKYQSERADEAQIRAWWERFPKANVGVVTGSVSGIVVLDIDGPEGEASLAKITDLFGPLPETLASSTGKGVHYVFRHPGVELRNFAKRGVNIDFRGDGGYICAPPSIHPSGREYAWTTESKHPANVPEWLLELLTSENTPDWYASLFLPKKETQQTASKPKRQLEGGAGAEAILNNCAFCQHCRDDAQALSEPEWYAMISNLARAENGDDLIHELSQPHRGYNQGETQRKIDHALEDGEPHTCQYIQDNLGFTGCPSGGCGVKAPVGFVSSPLVLAKITVDSAVRQLRQEAAKDEGSDYWDALSTEVIGALAVLRNRDQAEYSKFKATVKDICGKGINLNDLERSVKQRQANDSHLRLAQPNEKPLELDDILPDLPLKEIRRPYKWSLNENGVWQDTQNGPVCACPVPVLLTKRLQNIDTNEEKVELAFYRDSSWHYITATRPTVFNRSSIVNLGAHSLPVSSENSKHLVRYLSDFESANLDTLPVVRSVSHMGWVGSKRFLPGAEDDIHLDVDLGGTSSVANGYRQEGTLDEWIQFLIPVRKYPIARFTLASSFAGPLLALVSQRVFVVHNWGPSRGGKTASLKAALSVWGEPETIMASFNATKVGLERLAAFYSDLPLGIDERQVVGDRQGFVESLVYLLGIGKGKARGSKGGGLQAFQSWRTIALTTGEEPLSTDSSTQGIKTRALEIYGIPIDDEKLAQKLHQGLAANFGTAGPVFVKRILEELAKDPNTFKDDYQSVLEYWQSKQTGHMGSHISAITTVMLADYYASMWIFGMSDQEAYAESIVLAEYVLGQLETAAEADEAWRAMEYFISWSKVNANSFEDRPVGREWFGLRQAGNTLVFPMIFDRALKDGGFNVKRVLRDWADRGWLETEIKQSDGKRRFKVRKMIQNESMQFYSVRTSLAFQSDQNSRVSDQSDQYGDQMEIQ